MGSPVFSAVSLFSGCGGSDLGLHAAGVEPVWANEINPVTCDLYREVTGADVIKVGDIRDHHKIKKADILAGCYPCTGYSQGGRRTESDQINFLYQEFDRVLRKLRPVAFIVENVDGMRFAQNRHLLDNQLVRFRLAGYSVRWQVLDAKDYGLAQDRRRLFIVGIRSGERKKYEFPNPTHGPRSNDKTPYRTLRNTIWKLREAPPGSYNCQPFHWYYLSRNRRRTWSEQAPCIVAHWRHVGIHPDSPPLRNVGKDKWEFTRRGRARRLSYLECAALQGFPSPGNFTAGSVAQRFRAIGNAVPPPLFAAVAKQLVKQLKIRG